MSKTIKTIIVVASLVIALVITAILLLPKLLNTDTFKQQITQQVEQYTGQTLTITGDVKLALFPWLSLHTGAISLSQPTGITSKNTQVNRPLLQIAGAKIGVKLLPLLQNKFELSKIELNQPQVYFIAAKDGSTSLTGLSNRKPSNNLPKTSSTTTNTITTNSLSAMDKTSALGAIAISGISIINGALIVEDQVKNAQYGLDRVNIEAGDILSRTPTPIKISALASINSSEEDNTNKIETYAIEIQAQVSHSADLLSATLQQVNASITETGRPESARKLSATLDQLNFNQTTQLLDIQTLKLVANDGKLSPELSIDSLVLPLSDFLNNSSNRYVSPIIAFTVAEKNLGLKARGEISVKDWHTQALIKGQIVSEEFMPKKILDFFEMKYAATDKNVLNMSKFSSTFNGSTHGVALHNISFTLDDSNFIGDASLINFNDPHYMFDINLDQINIDRYLPKSSDFSSVSNPAKNGHENAAAGLAVIVPLPLFKNIFANGMFRISNLQANGAKLSDIVVDIKSNDKTVVIKPRANLYDGKTDGTITFSSKGDIPTLRIENYLQNVNFGPLLKDIQVSEKFAGKVTATTDITFTKNNGQQTNSGTVEVAVVDGAFKDFDIKKILDDVQNNIDSFRGKEIKQEIANVSETSFAQMNATLFLKDNVITNNDLNVKAPAFRIGGEGNVDLVSQTLEYATSVTVVNTNEGQGGKNRSDLKGLIIPVRFYGDLSNPQYQIDFRALLNENIKRELAIKKDELRLKAAKKLGLIKKTDSVIDDGSGVSKKDFEQQLKQKAIEKLFEKLF
jgi:AsmA protein